jgi:hypothetical protein
MRFAGPAHEHTALTASLADASICSRRAVLPTPMAVEFKSVPLVARMRCTIRIDQCQEERT